MNSGGFGLEWQSIDGCMVQTLLAREAMGRNTADRGERGEIQCCGRISRIICGYGGEWSQQGIIRQWWSVPVRLGFGEI
ncbi:MAG: hypothetical protein LBF75_06950 [Treponema sp.]|nr:hypothetical protein [Treponema sp.]